LSPPLIAIAQNANFPAIQDTHLYIIIIKDLSHKTAFLHHRCAMCRQNQLANE
jgi:hypothetical protein